MPKGICRLAAFQLPSPGISLGGSTSEIFQISAPFRNSRLSFWDGEDFTHCTNTLSIVAGWGLMISIDNSPIGALLMGTTPTIVQEERVGVSVMVGVGVRDGVSVWVGVFVRLGVMVCVGVRVGVRVGALVGVRVAVRITGASVRVGIRVGVRVMVAVGVQEGKTKIVAVGVTVGDEGIVGVGVYTGVGVEVTALCNTCCASEAETGVTKPGEQYSPVIVQVVFSSSCVNGSGAEGALIASLPFSPPSVTRTLCPAPKYCS